MLTASDLYCLSQGVENSGGYECFFCGSKCTQDLIHYEPPLLPGQRRRVCTKRPSSPYQCKGCWMWNRKRLTVFFVGGKYKDGQSPGKHSWWITETEALTIKRTDISSDPILSPPSGVDFTPSDSAMFSPQKELYDLLLNPPLRFVCSLNDGDVANQIQLCIANDSDKIEGETPLYFTFNNIPHKFCVYELHAAIRDGENGKDPGVQTLIRLLGKPEAIKRERGRPFVETVETPKKLVTPVSGQVQVARARR